MSYSWEYVKEHNLLSEAVIDCVPRYCDCGGEIYFTDNLTQCYCNNRDCLYKVASRLENMAKMMQVDGWGESTCVAFVGKYGVKSPFQALLAKRLVDNGINTGIVNFPVKVNDIVNKSKEPVELWQMVQYASLNGIDSKAYKLFKGYSSIEDFYSDMQSCGNPKTFIARRLESKTIGIEVDNVYNELVLSKDELLLGEKYFNITSSDGIEVHIAITGGVNGYKNKQEFIRYINARFNGKITAIFDKSVSRETDILVCDGDTGSSKFRNAQKLNSSGLKRSSGEVMDKIHGYDYIFVGTSDEVLSRISNSV